MAVELEANKKLTKKLPPHNLEAEEAVLGAILINSNDVLNRVVEILTPDSFYNPKNRLIYEAMFAFYNQNKPIDVLTLGEHFSAKNQLDAIGGREYLNDLMIDTTLTSNVEYYANIIKENALKRQLIAAGSTIIEESFKNPESKVSLEMAEKLIFEISQQKSSQQMEVLSSLLYETMEQLEYRCSNKGSCTGVPSGFYDLDASISASEHNTLCVNCTFDISRENMATGILDLIATFCAIFKANAVFPIEGRAARIIKSDF